MFLRHTIMFAAAAAIVCGGCRSSRSATYTSAETLQQSIAARTLSVNALDTLAITLTINADCIEIPTSATDFVNTAAPATDFANTAASATVDTKPITIRGVKASLSVERRLTAERRDTITSTGTTHAITSATVDSVTTFKTPSLQPLLRHLLLTAASLLLVTIIGRRLRRRLRK